MILPKWTLSPDWFDKISTPFKNIPTGSFCNDLSTSLGSGVTGNFLKKFWCLTFFPAKSLGTNSCVVVLPIPTIEITLSAATSGTLRDNWITSSLTFLTAYIDPVSNPTTLFASNVNVVSAGEYLTNSPLIKLWPTIVILSVTPSTFELNSGADDVNVLLLLVATIS